MGLNKSKADMPEGGPPQAASGGYSVETAAVNNDANVQMEDAEMLKLSVVMAGGGMFDVTVSTQDSVLALRKGVEEQH